MSYALNDRPSQSTDFALTTQTYPKAIPSHTATGQKLDRAERAMAQLNVSWLVVNRHAIVVDAPPNAVSIRGRFVTAGGEAIPTTRPWTSWVKQAVTALEHHERQANSVRGQFVVPGGQVWADISRDSLPDHFLVSLQFTTIQDRLAALEGRGLTRRETQVIEELLKGLTNAEAARALGISERTVHKHVENIFAKLNIHSRAQLFELARR